MIFFENFNDYFQFSNSEASRSVYHWLELFNSEIYYDAVSVLFSFPQTTTRTCIMQTPTTETARVCSNFTERKMRTNDFASELALSCNEVAKTNAKFLYGTFRLWFRRSDRSETSLTNTFGTQSAPVQFFEMWAVLCPVTYQLKQFELDEVFVCSWHLEVHFPTLLPALPLPQVFTPVTEPPKEVSATPRKRDPVRKRPRVEKDTAPWVCKEHNMVFKQASDKYNHLRLSHSLPSLKAGKDASYFVYKCRDCAFGPTALSAVLRHMEREHEHFESATPPDPCISPPETDEETEETWSFN